MRLERDDWDRISPARIYESMMMGVLFPGIRTGVTIHTRGHQPAQDLRHPVEISARREDWALLGMHPKEQSTTKIVMHIH
jgi:hypothetical protein